MLSSKMDGNRPPPVYSEELERWKQISQNIQRGKIRIFKDRNQQWSIWEDRGTVPSKFKGDLHALSNVSCQSESNRVKHTTEWRHFPKSKYV